MICSYICSLFSPGCYNEENCKEGKGTSGEESDKTNKTVKKQKVSQFQWYKEYFKCYTVATCKQKWPAERGILPLPNATADQYRWLISFKNQKSFASSLYWKLFKCRYI